MMQNNTKKITVVGGMNLDLLAFPRLPLIEKDSNPGKITLRPGGVGRNIAARLAAMGAEVFLITALGSDEREPMLSSFCLQSGINLSLALKTNAPTPTYLCIHDEKGDMALAVSDMTAVDAITPRVMEERMAAINQSDACVLDANLSPETLLYIVQNATVPLILDPVSCAKAPRVQAILPYLTAIKPNLLEAQIMTGEKEAEKAARSLVKSGVKNVFISMGAKGVCYADEASIGIAEALPLPAIPLTGAGDALCAGLTMALLNGLSPENCARAGCRAAYEALVAAL